MRARKAGVVANLERQVGLAACQTLERRAFSETKAKNNLYRHTSAKGGESDIIHHNKRHQGKKRTKGSQLRTPAPGTKPSGGPPGSEMRRLQLLESVARPAAPVQYREATRRRRRRSRTIRRPRRTTSSRSRGHRDERCAGARRSHRSRRLAARVSFASRPRRRRRRRPRPLPRSPARRVTYLGQEPAPNRSRPSSRPSPLLDAVAPGPSCRRRTPGIPVKHLFGEL